MELSKQNNGWIKIESEDDLPKECIECYFITEHSIKTVLKGYLSRVDNIFYDDVDFYNTNQITHYQPIIKPKPPIY